MNSNSRVVDFSTLGKRVLVGRDFGELAREHFSITEKLAASHPLCVFDGGVSINSSFFMGVFKDEVNRCRSLEEFGSIIDISKMSDNNKERVRDALQRIYKPVDFF